MASTIRYQVAHYMVEWTRRFGTHQQQYDAERALRDLQRGTT